MKYIDADKLKELLKERQEEKDYREVIWLIDSLQQEQPVEGLEEEVKKYWNAHALDYRIGRVADLDFLFLCARHFAEWGAEHLKQ